MIATLEQHAGDLLTLNRPRGGLYLWCQIADHLRVRDLLVECAREGVAFAPGEPFFIGEPSEASRNTLRLNFTLPSPPEIDEGCRRMGRALRNLSMQSREAMRDDRSRRPVTPIV